jgi:hypothetical protein
MALDPTESFATVNEANAYAAKFEWTDWLALSAGKKEASLREATLYIQTEWTWDGRLRSRLETPTSPWPYSLVYVGGEWLDAPPAEVKTATIHLARLAAKGPLLGGEEAGARKVRSVQIGSMRKEYEPEDASGDRANRLAFANSLLLAAGGRQASAGFNVPLRRVL